MIYEVVVDISNSEVDRVFDYRSDVPVPVGSRVLVPFGKRVLEGYVLKEKESSDQPPEKLKSILKTVDSFILLNEEMLQLTEFMKRHYHLRTIDILHLFIPSQMRNGKVKELRKRVVSLSADAEMIFPELKPNAHKQRELVGYLRDNGKTFAEILTEQFGNAALNALIAKGFVSVEMQKVNRIPYKGLAEENKDVELTKDQVSAVETISHAAGEYLLFGVTGSGKTEVYIRLIQKTVSEGKTAIFLVPEISLTPKMLKIFRTRFGKDVAILHSGLSAGERYDEWMRLKTGEARIAIGARSAIFAPLKNVGVIVVDEEHDGSYQSESNPRYDTLKIAEFRRAYHNATLVLGSATPSLETFYRSQKGEITLVALNNRINRRPLPKVEIVDMATEVRAGNRGFFSRALTEALRETVKKGNQAILFLNRRGYSSFVMCQKCGYVAKCTDCDVSLTFHAEENVLQCHYCGKKYYMLHQCPNCKSEILRYGKIGTERVVKELETLFPNTKILRMDNDTTSSKESHFQILNAFETHQAQILVGTQMVAKGHDFPDVTLVGILDGDQSLFYADYKSGERTFQLLTQVAGRSGRDTKSGQVILQTYVPKHYVLLLAAQQDYLGFYRKEIGLREASGFPPFTVLIRILYSDENEQNCIAVLNEQFGLLQELKSRNESILSLKKMKAPVKKIEKKYRYQIVLKLADEEEALLEKIYRISDLKHIKSVTVFTELNPQNMN